MLKKSSANYVLSAALIILWITLILPHLSLDLIPWGNDNAQYYLRALALSSGLGYEALEFANPDPSPIMVFGAPPLLPLLLAMPLTVFGDTVAGMKIWFYLLELAALFLVYLLYRNHLSTSRAWLTVILLAFSPLVMLRFPMVLTDILNIGLYALTLILLQRTCKTENSLEKSGIYNRFYGLLLGVAFGALILLRFGNIAWIAAGGVWLVWKAAGERSKVAVRLVWLYVAGVALITIILLLWIHSNAPDFFREYLDWHNREKLHGVLTTGTWISTLFMNLHYAISSLMVMGGWPDGWRGKNFFADFNNLSACYFALTLLFLIGLGIWSQRGKATTRMLLCFMIISPLVYLFADSRNYRYFLPLYMISLIFIVHGLEAVAKGLEKQRWFKPARKSFTSVVLVLWTLWCGTVVLPFTVKAYKAQPTPLTVITSVNLRDACKRLRQLRPDIAGKFSRDEVLLSEMVWLASAYSGMRTLPYMREEVKIDSLVTALARYDRVYLLLMSSTIDYQHNKAADTPPFPLHELIAYLSNTDNPGARFLRRELPPESNSCLDQPGDLTIEKQYQLEEDLRNELSNGHPADLHPAVVDSLCENSDLVAWQLNDRLSVYSRQIINQADTLSFIQRFIIYTDLRKALRKGKMDFKAVSTIPWLGSIGDEPMPDQYLEWYNTILINYYYEDKSDIYNTKSFYFDLLLNNYSAFFTRLEDVGVFRLYELDSRALGNYLAGR